MFVVFFFFKQKTAYEIMPSLVGSEMCIRDSYYMNKADPDCGTSFSWVTRALGPQTGFITGWIIMAADAIVMANLAQVAGQYFFLLFGWDSAANSTFAVTLVGLSL